MTLTRGVKLVSFASRASCGRLSIKTLLALIALFAVLCVFLSLHSRYGEPGAAHDKFLDPIPGRVQVVVLNDESQIVFVGAGGKALVQIV